MSWHINAIGTRGAVKAALQKDTNISPALKAALLEICDDKAYDVGQDGMQIKGSGHGGQGSYIHELMVLRFVLAKEDPASQPAVTTSTTTAP